MSLIHRKFLVSCLLFHLTLDKCGKTLPLVDSYSSPSSHIILRGVRAKHVIQRDVEALIKRDLFSLMHNGVNILGCNNRLTSVHGWRVSKCLRVDSSERIDGRGCMRLGPLLIKSLLQ